MSVTILTAERDLPRIVEGDDKAFGIKFTDSDTGEPIPIDGWTIRSTVKRSRSDSNAEAVILNERTTHTDAANGQSKVVFSSEDTKHLSGRYHYDIEVELPDGSTHTLMFGQVPFVDGVTD